MQKIEYYKKHVSHHQNHIEKIRRGQFFLKRNLHSSFIHQASTGKKNAASKSIILETKGEEKDTKTRKKEVVTVSGTYQKNEQIKLEERFGSWLPNSVLARPLP